MSRFLLLVVLFVLLSLVSARLTPTLPAGVVAAPSAAPSACVNSCSSHGNCTTAGAVSTCLCDAGYLGVDCGVASVMKPVCWFSGEVCSYWQIQDGYLYQRVTSLLGKGWVGVMWGSTDGMSGGQSTIMTIPAPLTPTVWEGYNVKKTKPTNTTGQSIAQANVTGSTTATGHLDVSFVRALNTGLTEHYVIPATAGTTSNMSVAYGAEVFDFHGNNATFFHIDIAAAAAGKISLQQEEEKTVETATLMQSIMKRIRWQ